MKIIAINRIKIVVSVAYSMRKDFLICFFVVPGVHELISLSVVSMPSLN